MIKIRQETQQDYTKVFNLVKAAFEHAEHTDEDEHNLIGRLRKSDAFIPALSLVAEIDSEIVGQIMFTKLKVGRTTQLALAPVAVNPTFQGQGVGGALILKGHEIAQKLGYEYSILIGHPTYYPRFGYIDAANFGIQSPFDLPEGVFMAINLKGKNTMLNDVVEYPKEFFEK